MLQPGREKIGVLVLLTWKEQREEPHGRRFARFLVFATGSHL
ncbi:hypothetical protein [Ktedonobacter sp. SOSP1-52]|nr:hypothetical protein [Ktedonobacter sp. SOSP1-52]